MAMAVETEVRTRGRLTNQNAYLGSSRAAEKSTAAPETDKLAIRSSDAIFRRDKRETVNKRSDVEREERNLFLAVYLP